LLLNWSALDETTSTQTRAAVTAGLASVGAALADERGAALVLAAEINLTNEEFIAAVTPTGAAHSVRTGPPPGWGFITASSVLEVKELKFEVPSVIVGCSMVCGLVGARVRDGANAPADASALPLSSASAKRRKEEVVDKDESVKMEDVKEEVVVKDGKHEGEDVANEADCVDGFSLSGWRSEASDALGRLVVEGIDLEAIAEASVAHGSESTVKGVLDRMSRRGEEAGTSMLKTAQEYARSLTRLLSACARVQGEDAEAMADGAVTGGGGEGGEELAPHTGAGAAAGVAASAAMRSQGPGDTVMVQRKGDTFIIGAAANEGYLQMLLAHVLCVADEEGYTGEEMARRRSAGILTPIAVRKRVEREVENNFYEEDSVAGELQELIHTKGMKEPAARGMLRKKYHAAIYRRVGGKVWQDLIIAYQALHPRVMELANLHVAEKVMRGEQRAITDQPMPRSSSGSGAEQDSKRRECKLLREEAWFCTKKLRTEHISFLKGEACYGRRDWESLLKREKALLVIHNIS
jgi:hypothetical protein